MGIRKAFASDFDGTLHFWDGDEHIRRADLAAIEAFRMDGGLFGVCTGRPLKGLTKQSDDLVDFDFFIAMSGASVFDGKRQPIVEHTIPREIVRTLYDEFVPRADANQAALLCAADDYWCLTERDGLSLLNFAHSFDDIPDPFCGFALGTITDEEACDMAGEINDRYGDVVTAFQNLNSIDVVPAGCSKGSGVRIVAEHYGIDLIAGMGDSFNDVPMFDAADIAYTFNSSPQVVREAADVLVSGVDGALIDFMSRHRPQA